MKIFENWPNPKRIAWARLWHSKIRPGNSMSSTKTTSKVKPECNNPSIRGDMIHRFAQALPFPEHPALHPISFPQRFQLWSMAVLSADICGNHTGCIASTGHSSPRTGRESLHHPQRHSADRPVHGRFLSSYDFSFFLWRILLCHKHGGEHFLFNRTSLIAKRDDQRVFTAIAAVSPKIGGSDFDRDLSWR